MAQEARPRINEEIRVPLVRVVDDQGHQLGLMSPRDAMRIAGEKQLDLIEIAPNATPPVCKIVEYGKFKYEHQKREKVVRKQTHVTQVKEVRLHPNIDTHDVDFKAKHSREFLLDGNKVKITVVFKGREMAYKHRGEKVLREFVEKLTDVSKIENDIRMEGNRMSVMIGPIGAAKPVKKKTAKAEKAKVEKAEKKKTEKVKSENVPGDAGVDGAPDSAAVVDTPTSPDAQVSST